MGERCENLDIANTGARARLGRAEKRFILFIQSRLQSAIQILLNLHTALRNPLSVATKTKKPDRHGGLSGFTLLIPLYHILQNFFTVLPTLYFLLWLTLRPICVTFELLTS